ncbi:MAG: MATE family efflux transporter, partial [Erysipelotrichaceae bacterium]
AMRYGVEAVGYLGISNRLTGMLVSASNGVQEGISVIIARYRQTDEILIAKCIKYSIGLNILIPIICATFYIINFEPIMLYFADGNLAVASMIGTIFTWELSGGVLNPSTNFMNGILYGYEQTKLVFIISFYRIIIFRNVILFILSQLGMGYQSLGIVMFISHVATFIISCIIMYILFGKNKKYIGNQDKPKQKIVHIIKYTF